MTAGAARGIRLPAPPGLPVIGAVAAGSPLLAVENQRGTLPIAPELFSPRADYLLQVRGNSVSGVGILDGDLLAVHHTVQARKRPDRRRPAGGRGHGETSPAPG